VSLVKTVTLEIRGVVADAAAKIGLIRKDVQALADKSPVELKAELTGSEEVKVRLKEIEANAERLKKEFPDFAVKLDTAAAIAKLAVLRAEIRKTADTGKSLSARISGIGAALSKATPAWTGFVAAGLALGPALLPVLAAVTGATIGMGAALAGAGSAVGIFALAAKSNLSALQKELLKVQAANRAANLALQTSAKNRTAAQDAAIVKAKMLTAAFQKEFGAEADAITRLKSAWLSFTTQPVVTNAIAMGARLLTAVLPHLTPLLKLGADAVSAFAGALAGFTIGGGLDKLVATLVRLGKIGLGGLLAVLHNLAVAFGALSGGAGNFAAGVISGLVKLSAAFATWAQNKGPGALSGLMDTIRKLGPGVLSLIQNLAAAVPALAAGLFPLAPVSLALANSLAKLIRNTPPGVITAIAVAFVGWTVAAKGLMAAGALGGAWKEIAKFSQVTKGATIAETIAAAATRAWGLAMDALPWVALAAAVVTVAVLIIKYHKQIWAFVQRVWDGILNVIQGVWNWIKGHWPLLLTIITGPFGLAITFIVRHWGQIVSGAQAVLGFFRSAWQGLVHLLEAPFKAAFRVISAIWHKILGFIHGITGFLGGGGGTVPGGRGHGMGGGSGGANAALARQMVPAWSSGAEWSSWNALAMSESGWSSTIANPTSGALGIAQALGHGVAGGGGSLGNQYGGWGLSLAADRAANSGVPQPQIAWMANYIRSSYGDPIGAWNFHMAHGSYDGPGPQFLPTGLSMALNTTGAPERVLSPGEQRGIERRLDQVIAELRKLPGVQAAQTARLLSGRPVAPRPSVFAAR
jgi:hypothetical protein